MKVIDLFFYYIRHIKLTLDLSCLFYIYISKRLLTDILLVFKIVFLVILLVKKYRMIRSSCSSKIKKIHIYVIAGKHQWIKIDIFIYIDGTIDRCRYSIY